MDTEPSLLERVLMDKMPYPMLKSKGKSCMVLDPSHVKQLSLIHVCKIGLTEDEGHNIDFSKIFFPFSEMEY
jgi:hypothetical protein